MARPSTMSSEGILQWNCRGIAGKVGELRQRLRYGKLHVWALLLQETNALPQISGFVAYSSPSIMDRRSSTPSVPPGKVAAYVRAAFPQSRIDLSRWCTLWQEVVAVLVRLPRLDVIVVSYYARPYGGSAARVNLGWIYHLRHRYPGRPILVAGDFNAPHTTWGYAASSARGTCVYDNFVDANFTLLNDVSVPTRRRERRHTPPQSPDLSWWLGSMTVSWACEPDCWGSDHHPIHLGLYPNTTGRLRRLCRVVDWDRYRSVSEAITNRTCADPSVHLRTALTAATRTSWVDESRPTPDLQLLRLWAARRQAEVASERDPASTAARIELQRRTAVARRHERRLERGRWLDWCASLGPSSSNASIWRTFRAMERGRRPPDPAASAMLAAGQAPSTFASSAARAFFPAFDIPAPPFTAQACLPTDAGMPPSCEDVDGIQAPFTMAEFLAAIDQAKPHSAPGPDGIPYELYKNTEGNVLVHLLDTINDVWTGSLIPDTWRHAEVIAIPKPGKTPDNIANLRPISLTSTLCKLMERMLATRLTWWLERYSWYHPAQIGFRPHLGTEDGLGHLSSMVLVGGRSRRIRTLLTMDIRKAYDHVSHQAIAAILPWLRLPRRVCKFVEAFLCDRTFSIRLAGHAEGLFTSHRGVPQGSVLAPVLFNIALLPLAWQLAAVPDIYFLIYADDITVWTVHPDLARQEQGLQTALDVTSAWCGHIGLELSKEKTAFMAVGNKYGRRALSSRPIRLSFNLEPVQEVSTLRVLGLEIAQNGSASPWVKIAKQRGAETIHLIRRIAQKSGGARTTIARHLVKAVLQPRLVYQAQFHHLTKSEWARLESINHEAMRAITALPRMTMIPKLQAEAQLNTIDELVHQRRSARALKLSTLPTVAALARYMGCAVPIVIDTATTPPWNRIQLTDNKPLGRLHRPIPRQATAMVSRLNRTDNTPDILVGYVDASITNGMVHTALVCPKIPQAGQTCTYAADPEPPAYLAELAAIQDGLHALRRFVEAERYSKLVLRTDSTEAIRDIRRVARSTAFSDAIHQLARNIGTTIRIEWVPRAALSGQLEADSASRSPAIIYPLPQFPEDNCGKLLRQKECLRRTTRALIPPCGSDLPGGLTRLEEVALRRLRVGVALTPAVTAHWPQHYRAAYGTTCPFCDAPINAVDVTHLLWSCAGLEQARLRHLRATGHRPGRPPDLQGWINGPFHRSLLNFMHECNLFVYV